MKSLLHTIFILCTALSIYSCKSNAANSDKKVKPFTDSEKFSFEAERAIPTNLDVINIMNSIPGNNSARILALDPGSSVQFSKDSLVVNLPYFGRMFVPSMNNNRNGYEFTSTNFAVDSSKSTSKKNVWIITVKDQKNIQQMFLESYQNGRAYLSINSNDRQAISYDGRIVNK